MIILKILLRLVNRINFRKLNKQLFLTKAQGDYFAIKWAFDTVGKNWQLADNGNLPIAIIWGVNVSERVGIAQQLLLFRVAFAYPETNWLKQRLSLECVSSKMIFYFNRDELLTPAIKKYAKKNKINIERLSNVASDISTIVLESKFFNGLFLPNQTNWDGMTPQRTVVVCCGCPINLYNCMISTFADSSVLFIPPERNKFSKTWAARKKVFDSFTSIVFLVWDKYRLPSMYRQYIQGRGALDNSGQSLYELLANSNNEAQVAFYRLKEGFLRPVISKKTFFSYTPVSFFAYASKNIMPQNHATSSSETEENSGLVAILNRIDFVKYRKMLDASKLLIKMMRDLEISYNNYAQPLGSLRADYLFNIKASRRVLVIGEEQADMSKNLQLLEAAVHENLESEFFYLPTQNQIDQATKNSRELKEYRALATVVMDHGATPKLLEAVDKVYVYSSIIGLEAIWHGCHVSVFGRPFYAGWGLTDDRTTLEGRQRKLTIEQLFCGAYLMCNTFASYNAIPCSDHVDKILTLIFKLYFDRSVLTEQAIFKTSLTKAEQTDLLWTKFWLFALRVSDNNSFSKNELCLNLYQQLPFQLLFGKTTNALYHTFLAYLLVGYCCKNQRVLNFLLPTLRQFISPKLYDQLIDDLSEILGPQILLSHRVWNNKNKNILNPLIHLVANADNFKNTDQKTAFVEDPVLVLNVATLELKQGNYPQAEILLRKLLLQKKCSRKLIQAFIDLARLTFNFDALPALDSLYFCWDKNTIIAKKRPNRATDFLFADDYVEGLKSLIENTAYTHADLSKADLLEGLEGYFGNLPYSSALISFWASYKKPNMIVFTSACLASATGFDSNMYLKLYQYLSTYQPQPKEFFAYYITLIRIAWASFQADKVKRLLTEAMKVFPNVIPFYNEAFLPILGTHDINWGDQWLAALEKHPNTDLTPLRKRGFLCLKGDFNQADEEWKKPDFNINSVFSKYFYPEQLIASFDEIKERKDKNVLIFKTWGPGDELTNAALYPKIQEVLNLSFSVDVSFICDSRFLTLFERNFPDIKFIPTVAKRSIATINNYDAFDQLPGSDLCDHFDNFSYEEVKKHDAIMLSLNAVREVETALGESRFKYFNSQWITPEPVLEKKWRERLQPFSHKMMVGLSWRSSLKNGLSRHLNTFDVSDIVELFDCDDVTFINLQYDSSEDDFTFLEQHGAGKIISFQDLDQYNDFEGVTALVSCLDLAIGPVTSATTFPRAVGCPTFFINRQYSCPRKNLQDKNSSIYSDNIKVITPDILGDVKSLIYNLKLEIRNLQQSGEWKKRRARLNIHF